MIKAVIFDMDGVISDTEPLHQKIEIELMKSYGHDISFEELQEFTATSGKVMWAHFKKKYYLPLSVEKLYQNKKERFLQSRNQEIKPLPGVLDLINKMGSKLKLAVASSTNMEGINLILTNLMIKDKFDSIISGHQVNNPKPSPDIFLETAKQLNLKPRECLVIEDSFYGIQAAKAAGMKCVAVTNTFPKERLMEADYIVDSLEQFDDGWLK